MGKIIGIDLGTTNSCAAFVEDSGNVKLIPYKGGEFTIPSSSPSTRRATSWWGHEAKRQWQLNPRNTVYASKPPHRSLLPQRSRRRHEAGGRLRVREGERNDVVLDIAGRTFDLSPDRRQDPRQDPRRRGHLLPGEDRARGRDRAGLLHRPPAPGGQGRGRLIGLEIVRIINEPTAASLAYGIGRNVNETVLIYDLGGGTFDVSIIEIRRQDLRGEGHRRRHLPGGIDFDNAIIGWVLSDFAQRHNIDLSGDPVAMQRIRDLAERAKIDLSARTEVPSRCPSSRCRRRACRSTSSCNSAGSCWRSSPRARRAFPCASSRR